MPKYPDEVMAALRQEMGLEENDISQDHLINEMSTTEILRKYLHWEGIIGYTDNILAILSAE